MFRIRISRIEKENEILQAEIEELRARNRALASRNQWLILQLGLLGFELKNIPEIPAKPAHTVVRKVRK